MPLFPVHRPTIGLSISGERLTLVELHRGWRPGRRDTSLRHADERDLPSGLVRPSASDRNLSDVPALAQEVRALLGTRRTLPVALSLPDLCAQVGLFEFEMLPKQVAEQANLLRWRFEHDLKVPMAEARLVHRVFHLPHWTSASDQKSSGRARVLAVAIRRDILVQYEQLCEQAGLLPVNVGIASLQLFDFCHSVMETAEELFFAYRSDDSFSFVAVRHGCPVFLRIKPLRQTQTDLTGELLGTLQFYDDQQLPSHRTSDARLRPLFFLGGHAVEQAPPSRADHSFPACHLSHPKGHMSSRIELIPLDWKDLPILSNELSSPPVSGLSAFASVMVS